MADKAERGWGHRDEIVVHPVQVQALKVGDFPGIWIERIWRWPLTVVFARMQNPSMTRQHSVGRPPSDTIVRPASQWRTLIGSARMAAMSASSNPETVLSRCNRAAKTNARSKPAPPPIEQLP
jgi:hypothetical protein